MKKWEKIEDKLNSKLLGKYNKLSEKTKAKGIRLKQYFIQKFFDFYNFLIPIAENLKESFKKMANINPLEIYQKAKELISHITIQNIIKIIKSPPYKKIGIAMKKNLVNIIFASIFVFSCYKISEEIKRLSPSSETNRSIASVAPPKESAIILSTSPKAFKN